MLSDIQKFRLKLFGRKSGDDNLGFPNPALDEELEKIRKESPHLFWQEWELSDRKFYDEPDCLHKSAYHSFVVGRTKNLFNDKDLK